jgi:hypothetical protein
MGVFSFYTNNSVCLFFMSENHDAENKPNEDSTEAYNAGESAAEVPVKVEAPVAPPPAVEAPGAASTAPTSVLAVPPAAAVVLATVPRLDDLIIKTLAECYEGIRQKQDQNIFFMLLIFIASYFLRLFPHNLISANAIHPFILSISGSGPYSTGVCRPRCCAVRPDKD